MKSSLLLPPRISHMDYGEIYFWTATINQWICLLKEDEFKNVIINSLQYLSGIGKIDVFGFVIMPNHCHFIWRINEPNGKESPQGSFLKYTAHQFKAMLREENYWFLQKFRVDACNKKYEFWQRDPLALRLRSKQMAERALNYIHNNPLAGRWKLVGDPCAYKYSSASFYEKNEKCFPFLKPLFLEM